MAFLDAREEAIYDFAKKYYQSFFNKNNFGILKKQVEKETASVVYADSNMLVKIDYDGKLFTVGFGSKQDTKCWGVDLIKACFKITDYKIHEDDIANRKKILSDSFHVDDYSGNAAFCVANFNKIKTIFSSENYIKTKTQLERLGLEKQGYYKSI